MSLGTSLPDLRKIPPRSADSEFCLSGVPLSAHPRTSGFYPSRAICLLDLRLDFLMDWRGLLLDFFRSTVELACALVRPNREVSAKNRAGLPKEPLASSLREASASTAMGPHEEPLAF